MRSHTPKGRLARDQILAAAEELLAARGFHGTSMRDVADAAGAPLATVVYHFSKKEQLYAGVLGDIGAALERDLREAVGTDDGGMSERQLEAAVLTVVRWAESEPGRVRLLVRELLDNPARVARAARLPLAPVLGILTELVDRGVRAGVFRATEPPETLVLQLVGGISYFVVARPTVRRIVGSERDKQLSRTWERDTIAFARRIVGLSGAPAPEEAQHHASQHRARARATRARPHRSQDDRPRRGSDEDRSGRVLR
jgi:AcrR family transcriptional regulator